MSYSDEDVEELRSKMVDYQDSMPRVKKLIPVGLAALIVVHYLAGFTGVGAFIYLFIGYKLAGKQGYKFGHPFFAPTLIGWGLIVPLGFVLEAADLI